MGMTGAMAGIITDDIHTKARIERIETARLKSELKAGKIVVVAGFQGIDEKVISQPLVEVVVILVQLH